MAEKRELSTAEKKQQKNERQKAVRQAWAKEKELVAQGEGTRDWTPEQQRQIMEDGHAEGFEGHHMKSVSNYPEHAGNPENIQMLSEDEHFNGAHQGNFHTQTNGYYNPDTGQMESFSGSELKPVEAKALTEPQYENGEQIQSAQGAASFNESAKSAAGEQQSAASSFNASAKGQSEPAQSAGGERTQSAERAR